MLTFFRHLRLRLLGQAYATAKAEGDTRSTDTVRKSFPSSGATRGPASPFGRYLLYAIGEIALVVIGILIALQINNWNDTRKDKIRENKTLSELKANLELNVKTLDDFVALQSKLINNMETMLKYLDGNIAYHDSLEIYAVGITYLEQIKLTTSTYETLKYQGMDLISSDSLRVGIVELHEREYEYFISVVRDVSMAYFSDRSTPLMRKYGEIRNMWQEEEFYYFLKGKITWKQDIVSDALDKKEKTNKVIHQIDEELQKQ